SITPQFIQPTTPPTIFTLITPIMMLPKTLNWWKHRFLTILINFNTVIMKNLKAKSIWVLFLTTSIFAGLSSCSNNDDDSDRSATPPTISSVSKAEEGPLSPTNNGYANNMYIIQGSGFAS